MQNHLFRNLLIAAVIVMAAIQIVPTIGWMTLNDTERQARLERWRGEDYERLKDAPGMIQHLTNRIKRWSEFDRGMVINLGLDLQGGLHMVLGFDMTPEAEARELDESMVQDIILRTVRTRINEYEAKEPIIQKLGSNQIQIQLPGEKDIQRAKDLIMKAAYLTFHMVSGPQETIKVFRAIDREFENGFVPFLDPPSERSGQLEVSKEHFELVRSLVAQALERPGLVPPDKTIAFSPPPAPWQDEKYLIYLMDREEGMTGENLKSASAAPDPRSPGNWQITFEFGAEGKQQFADLTEQHIDEQMAIVVDGNVVSAPTINERIFGTGQISGSFTAEEAKDLAIALNSGSMPVPVREDYTAIVGPSLGRDSVEKGVNSSIIGLILVMVFMLFYYRLAGMVANISLALNALIILGAFAYFNITLTLPGIAGLILTIGMAVDANVIIFERLREEQATGKSLAACVDEGFTHATSAILDANVTTLIAAAVLTQFGTGPVQGFAIALMIGVCSSVFAALVITRAQMDFLTKHSVVKSYGMSHIIPMGTKFKFLEKRRLAVIVSGFAIIVGIALFVMRGEENFGVDFRNGTNAIVALNTTSEVSAASVRDRLGEVGFDSPTVQDYQEGNESRPNSFVIRVGETGLEEGAPAGSVSTRIQEALLPLTGAPESADLEAIVELLSVETVGPAVGARLQRDAVNAIFFALIFIVLYLWFRFEWKFAFGAVVALAHDVLIVIGMVALAEREITIPVVAALLTIIGYSLNDTIVVFDRMREDLALNKARGLSFLENLNMSINRTLSRTLLTSVTTLFVVVVLFFYGGSAINDFAFALIMGIIVGTYSSIFVATPVVYWWESFRGPSTARGAEGRGEGGGGRSQHRRRPQKV